MSTNIQIDNLHGFKYRIMNTDLDPHEQLSQLNTITHNALFFQLDGELKISIDDCDDFIIKPGNLYFLPRGANITACILGKEIKYIVARLDHYVDANSPFIELLKDEPYNNTYMFSSLPIREPMQVFLTSIKRYIIDGIENQQLQDVKFVELYIIFRTYYSKQECINLFYPIIKRNSKFKTFVLDNYQASTTIEELAQMAKMSRSTFDRTFKEHFGITPLKWIDIQTRMLIMRKASEPNVTVKDIMYEVGVYNPSQFTKLCKRLCGVVPSQLVRRYETV